MGKRSATAVIVILLLAPLSAVAHEETALDALAYIDDVAPDIAGVSFRVAHLTQPMLVATNRTDRSLVVYGPDDEPFLRLRRGRVETNVRSPLTFTSRSPAGVHAPPPPEVDPRSAPRWATVARQRTWSWFDPRVQHQPSSGPVWRVNAALGRRTVTVRGGFEELAGHGHFVTELERAPAISGLEIRLLDGAVPALFARNATGRQLTVYGRSGEPFLRIGPEGVAGNVRSPDYHIGARQTVGTVPRGVDPRRRPRWRRLSAVPVWSWLELRARLPARVGQRAELGNRPRAVLRWETPARIGARPVTLAGVVRWIPPRATATRRTQRELPLREILLVAALVAAVVATTWAFRDRRRTAG